MSATIVVGKATYRLVSPDKGWGGPYGQYRKGAKWECVDCGRILVGDDSRPWDATRSACALNGHGPCSYCGKQLPRLTDGSMRAHPWRICPGKTAEHKVVPRPGDMADAQTPGRCA